MDPLDRVLEMCEYWEVLAKGEFPLTRAIKEAVEGTNEAQNERIARAESSD